MRPERDDYLDDGERGRFSPRRILASGWFRAVVVLGALALVLIVAVPYVLRWLDGTPPPPQTQARQARPPVPAPALPAPPAPAPAPRAQAPASPPAAERPAVAQPKPEGRAPAAERRKPMAAAVEEPRRSGAARTPERAARPAEPRPAPRKGTTGKGSYWVQVGAFREASNAQRLAESLRGHALPVQVAQVRRGEAGPARHEVVVTGASVETVSKALAGSGTAQQEGSLVTVRPALELRDAVALSRRLAGEGLAVRIRRTSAGTGAAYHVVRVGGYPSRAAAEAARKEVQARGLTGFVAQGAPR